MLLQQLVNGITIGSNYALVAIGYTLIFGVLEIINFANGSIYMLGGYITLMFYLGFKGYFWLSFALGIIVTGLVGYSMDRFALRRLRQKKAPKMAGLISTLGIATMIDNFVLIYFGAETKPYPNFLNYGSFEVGGAIISYFQIIILLVAIILMVVLTLLINRTKLGKSMRCIAQNAEVSKLMGINVKEVISITFIISSCLAAVSGTLVGMYYRSIDVSMGFSVGMKTFASAVLGGVGVLSGAMLGGLLVGIIETLGASYISSGFRDAFAFIILILILLFKPSGLLGKPQIKKV